MVEIRTTGRYFFSQWTRNGKAGFNSLPNFFHFGEVYVAENTSVLDLGSYEISLTIAPESGQSPVIIAQIAVLSPGIKVLHVKILNSVLHFLYTVGPSTSVSSKADVVSVSEGGSVDISCTSTGVPVPTISWTLNNMATPFNRTDSFTDHSVFIQRAGSVAITAGRVVSTLHIVNPLYPADEGVYVCIGLNTHARVTSNSSDMIRVQVLGMFIIMIVG